MDAPKDTGGPAFPFSELNGGDYSGMTLRDWFAGQALAGVLDRVSDPDEVSARCYRIADAMLAARNS